MLSVWEQNLKKQAWVPVPGTGYQYPVQETPQTEPPVWANFRARLLGYRYQGFDTGTQCIFLREMAWVPVPSIPVPSIWYRYPGYRYPDSFGAGTMCEYSLQARGFLVNSHGLNSHQLPDYVAGTSLSLSLLSFETTPPHPSFSLFAPENARKKERKKRRRSWSKQQQQQGDCGFSNTKEAWNFEESIK